MRKAAAALRKVEAVPRARGDGKGDAAAEAGAPHHARVPESQPRRPRRGGSPLDQVGELREEKDVEAADVAAEDRDEGEAPHL